MAVTDVKCKLAALLLGPMLAATAGCARSPATVGSPCNNNRDCVGGQECVSGTCIAIGRANCHDDSVCAPNEFCDLALGLCTQLVAVSCNDDKACAADQRCDTGSKLCVRGNRSCAAEADCASIHQHCDLNALLCRQCIDGSQCASGLICADGDCVDPTAVAGLGPGTDGGPDAGPAPDSGVVTGSPDAGPARDAGPPTMFSLQLDAVCTKNTDCTSAACFTFPTSAGSRCVKTCASSADCPARFTCYEGSGVRLCVSQSHFPAASFASTAGSACTDGGQCHSDFCGGNRCIETCQRDGDCAGAGCSYVQFTVGRHAAICQSPQGGANGAGCGNDGDCASGICRAGTCRALCHATKDCGADAVCQAQDYTSCSNGGLGVCLNYEAAFAKACVPAQHGNGAVGTACTQDGDCRSSFCDNNFGLCSDLCGTDADCPSTHRCKPRRFKDLPDGQRLFTNACLPIAN